MEYACFRAMGALVRALPLETASCAMGRGWRLFAPFSSRHARALANLQAAMPEKTAAERQAIVLAMWENLGRVFAEEFHLKTIVETGRLELGREFAELLPADGRFFAGAPHLGNWELASATLALVGVNTAGIYQRIKNPLIDAYVFSLRAPLYPGGLIAKHDNAARRLLQHLRRDGAVASMVDLRDNTGLPVPFFGRPAPSSPFPAMAARRFGVPLFAGWVVRLDGVRFRGSLTAIEVPHTDDIDADIAVATANLQHAIEAAVRAHPEQWMWAHRRWG
ncbi:MULTISPECIES: hypothetical protein [unclassified Beijerinckia]|uniref:LpxL/LpxP family acyltransferase n=1 Tax=unclassified Beijerinckia TaxID=2638183 RepID=UPI001114FB79|nr:MULTISPECIES: hypothetical protein [unclassified Beijerinckia]MDH7795511.1 KDO2-lipid IV(A) lauroyltransferase [Beijerinckia sp. GAS462]